MKKLTIESQLISGEAIHLAEHERETSNIRSTLDRIGQPTTDNRHVS